MVEHPGRFLLLDLPTKGAPTDDRSLLPTATDPDIAVRKGRRLVPRWREPGSAEERDAEGGQSTAEGPVLIVGGTGGIGAVLARHLVGTGTSHLVLASRRGPDAPEAVALGAELTAAGAKVDVVACDATDAEAVAAALRALPAPPSLVVHAAGVLDDGLLGAQDATRLATVLRPKIDTVEVLDAAVHDRTELIVFSSIVGELGSAGQAGYAAANAALDAWATARRRDGAHRRAIAWGPWDLGAGMTAEMAARTGGGPAPTQRDGTGVVALTPRTGLALFDAARSRAEPVLVAAPLHRGWLASAGPLLPPPWRDLAGALPTAAAAGSVAAASAWASRLAGLEPAARTAAVLELVQAEAAAALGHRDPRAATASVGADRDFRGLGFDSLTSVELRNRLSAVIGRRLPATVAFDYPTPRQLAGHLTVLLTGSPGEAGPTVARAAALDEPVAVVGIGCRFPGGVTGPDDLWDLVDARVDTIGPPPRDRGWDLARHADAVRSGAFLDDVAGFDAEFFSISAREALAMDPQQRLLLEVSWEALERAGVDPTALRGSRTGVFVGTNGQDYLFVLAASDTDASAHAGTGNAASVLSGRVSYVLGLRGPSLTVDTACSSSLVSVHLAAAALRSGECDLAIAGGVTVMSGPGVFVDFARQGGLAGDGRCKAFSEDADGTAWGEGAGVLVLQRLSDAMAAGRPVLAVIRGSAVNSDGASNGLTAPNGPSQERVIRDALASAGLAPHEVDAVEAHGTGTRLGDPIEAQALLATYGRDRDEPLRVGSVKSNIGHTQAAAGVAGMIKMIGALRHGRLPASLHVGEPSRHVDWDSGAVRVLAEPAEWPAVGRPRRAGISSFGLSGTNAHVVLEQAPVPPEESKDAVEPVDPGSEPGPVPLVLSARTPSALAELAGRLGDRLAPSNPAQTALPAVAASLTRRTRFEYRAVLLVDGPGAGGDVDGVRAPLESLAESAGHPALVTGTVRPGGTGLLLPGQGAQRPGMGRGLAAEFPVFAEAFDDALAALGPFLDRPLRDVCWGDDAQCLADTRWAQPALFALQVAGSRLLVAWGLEPLVVIGHSVGEIAAAHLCGALSLDDAARLAATRGRLMAELPRGGSMAALSGPPAALAGIAAELPDGVAVAARNSSTGLVVSGESAALEALLGGLDPAVRVSRLHTSHAFHSPLMAPAAQALAAAAGELAWAPPRLPAASTVSGAMVAEQTWSDPGHWSGQLTHTVLFADAVSAATAATGVGRWAEVGVHPTLVGHVRADQDTVAVCLGHADEPAGIAARRAAARLWCAGAELPGWLPDTGPHFDLHADLPTYPFEHRRYWPAIRPANDLTRLRVAWTALDQADRVPGGRWILLTGSRGPADPATDSTAKALREILDARVVATDVELRRALAGPDPVAGVVAVVGDAGEVPDLVRAVVADGATATRLWCLTRGAVRWEAGDGSPDGARSDGPGGHAADRGPDPRAASVWGIGRSAALEHPTVWGGLVDVSDPADDPAAEAAAVAGVLAGGGEDQVAVRGGRAYGRRLVPATDSGQEWQPSGTVLVTGGTGALGAVIARHLV
ncbi:MAG TPA: SDR family NAD(P)-dependent oxidoreductase, partial [Pseudonocardia sp.]|nr:SDR family NAD(P)-dependent oxidoreductase [Pseudonocardia sp.]